MWAGSLEIETVCKVSEGVLRYACKVRTSVGNIGVKTAQDRQDWDVCYAHTLEGVPSEQWQTLRAHAEAVAKEAARFAEAFGSSEAARLIGKVHDAGKSHPAFQAYLRGQGPGHPHAADGAKWLDAHVPTLGRLLAYTVDGHHAGLPDGEGDATSLTSHLCKAQEPQGVEAESPKDVRTLLPDFLRKDGNLKVWLWVKMLYSCLVDADWLDTERFMAAARAATRPETFDDLHTLLGRYHAHMATFRADTPVNKLRTDILQAVLAKAKNAPGLYTLTVPTGGGKTLASLGFALEHAVANGKNKVVYAIPYSTIIEQTSKTLSDVLGARNVLEHHAEAKWCEEKDEVANPLRQLTENWAGVPVVVTTNVQFFESFFSAQSSRCRKLHNVAGSVIILDEAQKLPEKFLAPCAELLRRLVSDYGCTVVLCTATQPDLSAFGLKEATELAPDVDGLYAALRRVDYHLLGRMEWPALADRIAHEQGALCVVNTRQDARDLYEELAKRKGDATFHLSTWMCPAHRRDTITQIRERLKAKVPTYVVSTSLIEAGVDLDFPAVFRALAGLDSLAQAAGRCNREGKLLSPDGSPAHGQVYLFEEPKPCAMGTLRKAIFAAGLLPEGLEEAPHHPAAFSAFFKEYFNGLNDRGETILDHLQNPRNLRFREVSEHFRMIPGEGEETVFVPYGEAKDILAEVIEKGLTKARLRALRGARLQVRHRALAQLRALIPLKIFDPKTGHCEESPYYALPDLKDAYSSETGLNITFETLSATDLIDN